MLKFFKNNTKHLVLKHKIPLKFISLTLVLALLFTSLPLGGMVASAAEVNDENTIITVEKELTEYRTEYSKTYLMSNGTLESVISANPMHYKNDSGNWVDIDSTLVLEETEDGEVYKNKAGGYAVSFPTKNESGYSVTSELLYQRQRSTKYYAIAGIDYDADYVNLNDLAFEMPTNFTTTQQIIDYLFSKNIYKMGGKDSQITMKPNPVNIGDNMVGFLSQIGWIGDNPDIDTPEPRIEMEKIFVDVDTNGGNGGETFIWEALVEYVFGDALLHSKIPHRTPVIEKTIEFLGE